MGSCFVFDTSGARGLCLKREVRRICSMRTKCRPARHAVTIMSLSTEGIESVDGEDGDAVPRMEQLGPLENVPQLPSVVEPVDEFASEQNVEGMQLLRKIGAAGTHTFYRVAEDLRSMVSLDRHFLNVVPSRILSVSRGNKSRSIRVPIFDALGWCLRI